jgi:hypothetical protein
MTLTGLWQGRCLLDDCGRGKFGCITIIHNVNKSVPWIQNRAWLACAIAEWPSQSDIPITHAHHPICIPPRRRHMISVSQKKVAVLACIHDVC